MPGSEKLLPIIKRKEKNIHWKQKAEILVMEPLEGISKWPCNMGKDICTVKRKAKDAKNLGENIRYLKNKKIYSVD